MQQEDAERIGKVAAIHPLVAQALGWLPRDRVARIREWGLLDVSIEHVARMLSNGHLRVEKTSAK